MLDRNFTLKENYTDFLVSFFDACNKSTIKYGVLRNYDQLPFSTAGSDIDILVENSKAEEFIDILVTISKQFSARVIVYYQSGFFYRLCLCNPDINDGWGIQFDIHTNETYKGLAFYSVEKIFQRLIFLNNIKVVNEHDAMVLAFFKECLSNGVSRKNYLEESRKSFAQDEKYFFDIFVFYFGYKIALRWVNFFNDQEAPIVSESLINKTRHQILIRNFIRQPVGSIKSKIEYHFDRVQRVFKPIGFTLAVLGTDGSGKTTIINKVRPIIEQALHSKINYQHMRPNFIPSIASLFGKKVVTSGMPVDNPHESSTSGIFGSLIRLSYYSIDYTLGFMMKIYISIIKKPNLVVFDRYYYDYITDPKRSRINLPRSWVAFFLFFFPKPNLVICLGADPKVIVSRKAELPIDEVSNQVESLQLLSQKVSNAYWVDTGVDIDSSAGEALELLTRQMSNRYKNIL